MTEETAAITEKPVSREKENNKESYFVRFTTGQRIEHIVLMVTFIVLAVTGLAQRYSTAEWAEWIIINFGGIEFIRLIHRIFALVFTLHAIYHISNALYGFFVKRRKLAMALTLKDFRDVLDTLKYSFGFTDKEPRAGRYDYRQKFEYWGMLFGSIIIIVTGYILAFPVAFTRLLPGQLVAAAVEIHGWEATLAVITIVVWHLYDVILRPGVFPADTTIFTGKISRERMLEEHPLEYEEWLAEKSQETPEPPPETVGEETI